MSYKITSTIFMLYLFFGVYFFSYIGEYTLFKYIVLIIFQLFLLKNYRSKKETKITHGLSIIIFGIIFILILSLIINFNFSGFFKTISVIDLFIFTFILFLSNSRITDSINNEKLMLIITNTLFLTLIFAFLTQFDDVVSTFGRNTIVAFRHQFGMGAASIVGFLCFIEFVFSYYLLLYGKVNKSDRLFCVGKIIISILMINYADIKSAMISALFFILLSFISKLPKVKNAKIIKILSFFLFSIFLILFLYNASLDMDRLNFIFSQRFVYYKIAFMEVINTNLVFGVGSFRNSDVDLLNMVQVDNSFLDIFYQYGLICALLFISLILFLFKCIIKINTINSIYDKNYIEFIKAYFLSVILYSMAEKNLFSLTSALGLVTFIFIFRFIYLANRS